MFHINHMPVIARGCSDAAISFSCGVMGIASYLAMTGALLVGCAVRTIKQLSISVRTAHPTITTYCHCEERQRRGNLVPVLQVVSSMPNGFYIVPDQA